MNKAAAILCLLCLSLLQRALAAPAWIEQASNPGPDVPPIGQSRFDQLFLDPAEGYRIPYPFSRLIETLESGLDNGNNPAVRQVLIPMGRSLQRDTPAPDYFHFPREVIAIEGEPVTSGRDAGMVMEYRLFIAHQPRTETLEVISYNDAAGRFEFQVVDDYAADAKPRARPANRVMCMSCHHNAAPIFPVTPWRETSFNVEVAKRLVAARPDRYGSLIGLITLDAGVIDVLIERANYLSATQTVWQDGCTSIRCRAAMLRTALQFRLSGESSFDLDSPRYRLDYSEELSRNWQLRWPDGLALPGSRLTDRSPFSDDAYASRHPAHRSKPRRGQSPQFAANLSARGKLPGSRRRPDPRAPGLRRKRRIRNAAGSVRNRFFERLDRVAARPVAETSPRYKFAATRYRRAVAVPGPARGNTRQRQLAAVFTAGERRSHRLDTTAVEGFTA
jgi:hypothetical protein